MTRILARENGQIMIDCQFISGLDFTSLQAIRQILYLASKLNRNVVFAGLKESLRKHIEKLDTDYFRNVSKWEDIDNDDLDWKQGSQSSLNGSAFGENNVEEMLAKRKNLEDLTPIPEEPLESDTIEMTRSADKENSPLANSLFSDASLIEEKKHNPYAHNNAFGNLAFEPHLFGSSIPIAVGTISYEKVLQKQNNRRKIRKNKVEGHRIQCMVTDFLEFPSDDSEYESDVEKVDDVVAFSRSKVGGSQLTAGNSHEKVELLEFRRRNSTEKVKRHYKVTFQI